MKGSREKGPVGVLPWAGLAAGFLVLVIIYVPFATLDL